MSLLNRILTCVDRIFPGLHNDSIREWERVTEEGKAVREELEKVSERPKEATGSAEVPESKQP